jgi:hypothetical protein
MREAKKHRERSKPHIKRPLATLWRIPQDGQPQLMAFDAIAFNNKHFTIGWGLGQINEENGPPWLSTICGEVIKRIEAYTSVEKSNFWFLEFANKGRIEHRIRETFKLAEPGSAIMMICHTSEIYDGLMPFFKLEWDPTRTHYIVSVKQ